jgi:hypothetical protein
MQEVVEQGDQVVLPCLELVLEWEVQVVQEETLLEEEMQEMVEQEVMVEMLLEEEEEELSTVGFMLVAK